LRKIREHSSHDLQDPVRYIRIIELKDEIRLILVKLSDEYASSNVTGLDTYL
jgi:hypothetical protein